MEPLCVYEEIFAEHGGLGQNAIDARASHVVKRANLPTHDGSEKSAAVVVGGVKREDA
jgi:hypothetical protein